MLHHILLMPLLRQAKRAQHPLERMHHQEMLRPRRTMHLLPRTPRVRMRLHPAVVEAAPRRRLVEPAEMRAKGTPGELAPATRERAGVGVCVDVPFVADGGNAICGDDALCLEVCQ